MTGTAEFVYARIRLQANFARLLQEPGWDHLLRIQDFGHFVQMARDTCLRPWVLHFAPHTEAHQIELHLRCRFRDQVQAVASWLPRAWQPAANWVARLPDLSAMEHLRAGNPAYPWMASDAVLAEWLADSQAPVSGILRRLLREPRDGGNLHDQWISLWQAQWPQMPAVERRVLLGLQAGLRDVMRPRGPQADESHDNPGAGLQARLHGLFRWHTQEPVGAFSYLALFWLEMVRLRGALLRRRLLPIQAPRALA